MNAADLPYHWPSSLQTVHLPGVQKVPELPQYTGREEKGQIVRVSLFTTRCVTSGEFCIHSVHPYVRGN